ncbi:hypothetical protein V5N11_026681 [Cardamine amara subsp. amara]|uniref:Uncharacterized protein n=1 Tax=Cardamine amara subsp. amara TaxID=228776 RepID=A0ABD1B0J3_CARAN
MFERFKGEVRKSWTFPGFIVLLELLAYEAISSLKIKYRKDVSAGKNYPRMCKRKFVPNGMSGYPLEDINKTLGCCISTHPIRHKLPLTHSRTVLNCWNIFAILHL